MDRADKEYYEAILTLTASPEWDLLVKELEKEVYQKQSDIFDIAENWDDVNVIKGECKARAEIINLRADTITILELDERGEL